VDVEFARQLERELYDAIDEIKRMKDVDRANADLVVQANRLEAMLSEANNKYDALADEFMAWRSEKGPDGYWVKYEDHQELVEKLKRELAEAREQRDRLAEALENCLPHIATEVIEHCDGKKCKEIWCAGCSGEQEAKRAAEKGTKAYRDARHVLAAVKPQPPTE
jgi:predicted RNase H-like nuclease (RuvC/YqgF family)